MEREKAIGSRQAATSGSGPRDLRVALICGSIVFGMLGMAYAAVPLYQLFCQVTGYAGTTQRATAPSDHAIAQTITMRFDANISSKLAWTFKPVTGPEVVHLGENRMAHYTATNTSDKPLWGTATFNVSPASAGVYFNKIECFCFTEQKLEPGESIDMPVSYFIDPEIVNDKDAGHITQITLSYTFFPLDKSANDQGVSAAQGERADLKTQTRLDNAG